MAKYFKFNKDNIKYEKYSNGRTAITLVSPTEELLCKVTVNIPNESLKEDEVIIKDYSENEGILQDLIDSDIVKPVRVIETGYIECVVCKLI